MRTAATAAIALLAAPGCGVVATTAPQRPASPPGGMPAAAAAQLRLDGSQLDHRGSFRAKDARLHELWVAARTDGTRCVLDVEGERVGAGCDRTLFGEHELAFVEGSDGGPAPAPFTELHVAGVASRRVRSVELELSDGTTVLIELSSGNAFFYAAPAATLNAAVVPTAIAALDAGGRKIDSLPLLGR